MSASIGEIAAVLSFVITDYFNATGLPPADLRKRAIAGAPSTMAAIIQRAVQRGEVDSNRLTLRTSLPVDLLRHDLIMTQEPIPEDTLVEIVERIFFLLIGRGTSRPSQSLIGAQIVADAGAKVRIPTPRPDSVDQGTCIGHGWSAACV
jgi:hypothetical protein